MATTNTRYVDPNAAAGGNGTTNALSGANCAYVSLAAWEAARQADLVSGDIIERVVCSSDDAGATHLADATACTIDGWTTDATRYIQIEAASSHGGKWDDTIYRFALGTNADVIPIGVGEADVRIIGIQFRRGAHWGTYSLLSIPSTLSNVAILVDKCIFHGNSLSAGVQLGINIDAWMGSGAIDVRNSLFYDWVNGTAEHKPIRVQSSAPTVTISNCTFHNSYYGVYRNGGTVHVKNCGFASCTTGISGTVTETTNSTDSPTFVNEAGDDFHLAAGDTTWKNQGTDLSATFTDDIDGETRPTGAGTWDIGCDEYVSSALWLPFMKSQIIGLGGFHG